MTVPAAGDEAPAGARRVRSAERVGAVLDLLARAGRPVRHGEVASALGLPKSSATNLLGTLIALDLVRRDEQGYALGVRLIELGAAAADGLELRHAALPVLRELCDVGIGTSNLGVLRGHEVLYIEKLNNPEHLIQIATRIGGAVPAHVTALGKVLVAGMEPRERRRWIAEHSFVPVTEHTITSRKVFAQTVEAIAEQGYGLDDQEQNLRVLCIAAPVRDHTGATVAAISLTCLDVDVRDRLENQIEVVVSGAARVSQALGARPGQP